MNKSYPVYTLKNECQDCYKCIRNCPVKAIKIENGHASVIPEKCIACGSCIKVCPQHAKKVRDDVFRAKELIASDKPVVVSIAPSWISTFGVTKNQLIAGFKALGFDGVSETALGAQEVSIETASFLRNKSSGLYISSACPAIVDYVCFYSPEHTDSITKILSPALAHAKMLKAKSPDISVVFIGPCSAKKKESDKHNELIDVAITFSELADWLSSEGVDFAQMSDETQQFMFDEEAYEGSLYPIEGGMNQTIKKCGESTAHLINISSIDSLREALLNLDSTSYDRPVFIEALACSGGCINGPCISEEKSQISAMFNLLSSVKERDYIPDYTVVSIAEDYDAMKVGQQQFSIEQIMDTMKSIGKFSIEDELNCGGCGYDTCRNFCESLLALEAEPSMCTSYMRKIAAKKAGAMLRCMPSGAVIIDNNFQVIESNEAFVRMFALDLLEIFNTRQEGIAGASIEKIVPCLEVFSAALRSGRDIHKERYSIKDKLYDITAFAIEEEQMVGAVFTDVTKTEMKREEIARKAQSVINKNITTVQEIACLLGEHMVDTELILSSISESYDATGLEGE